MRHFKNGLLLSTLLTFTSTAQADGATPPSGPIITDKWSDLFSINKLIGNITFDRITSTYITVLLLFGSIIALIYLALSALQMVTASGDVEKFEKAKKGLVTSIIGLIIMITSLTIAVAARNLASPLPAAS